MSESCAMATNNDGDCIHCAAMGSCKAAGGPFNSIQEFARQHGVIRAIMPPVPITYPIKKMNPERDRTAY